jgi:hypothetical protein
MHPTHGVHKGGEILRPSDASAEVARLGKDLFLGLDAPIQPLLSPFALSAVGVSPEDERVIARILDAYNHANSMNLIALNMALTLMGEPAIAPGVRLPRSEEASLPGEPEEIPPMLTLEEMGPSTKGIVLQLMSLRPKEKVPVIASLYRHLAHWPGHGPDLTIRSRGGEQPAQEIDEILRPRTDR